MGRSTHIIEEVWSLLAFFFHPERHGLVSFYKVAIYKKVHCPVGWSSSDYL